MNFVDSIKHLFSDRRFVIKAGVLIALFVCNEFVSLLLRYLINFTSYLPTGDSPIAQSLFPFILSLILSMMTFPIWLYYQGYQYLTADSLRRKNDRDALPEHTNLTRTLAIGGVYIGVTYTFDFILSLVASLPVIVLIALLPRLMENEMSSSAFLLLISISVGLFVVFSLVGLVIFLFDTCVAPSMMYLYLRSRSFASTFSFKNIRAVISIAWKEWLLYYFVVLLLRAASAVLSFLMCCVPVVAPALLKMLLLLCFAGMLGSIYEKIDSGISDRDLS